LKKITDLKSASNGKNQKNIFCKGGNLKKKIYREVKQNTATLQGVNTY
jgi:hypothetical protein